MHKKLIQLAANKVGKNEHIDYMDICEDALFLEESDWGGDEENYEETFDYIKMEFEDVATVNKRKRTITFKDRETIKEMWKEHIKTTCKNAFKKIDEGQNCNAEYMLRKDMNEPFGMGGIYYFDYCRKASSLIADYLAGYIPQTVHIGAILDYHC